ncbi:hypothetical protein HCW_00895 [Helicobacter cetorum MIT 00-7128]|uniref:Uncharacterized protein n=1 Tax=Helicobacter cetorum (strain ATCC BAA-429 / MIT 00-7128) TaxID=182217 RepID=I0EKK3_HELC0|nr:hypothetical protein HCW_00895 [Helicobacter cetorum MIT 00-7128]
MDKTNNKPIDRQTILVEELNILQGVINRMSQHSLECKKWTLALATGVLSLNSISSSSFAIESLSYGYLCFLGVLLICFWFLDAYYLRFGRMFREQHKWLIENRPTTAQRMFEVLPRDDLLEKDPCRFNYLSIMFSVKGMAIYWILFLSLVGLIFYKMGAIGYLLPLLLLCCLLCKIFRSFCSKL